MKSKYIITVGIATTVVSLVAVALIVTSVALSTANSSQAIPVPQNATASSTLSPADKNVVALLNNATKAVNNGNNTQAIIDLIQAVQLDHSLNTHSNETVLSSSMPPTNQTAGHNLAKLFK